MVKMKVVRVSRTEFELEDGRVFPIDPSLLEEMTPSEFQDHYDFAVTAVEGCRVAGGDDSNRSGVGHGGENTDGAKSG